ncbi:4Fe-4S binding protein [Propionivibrio sp.]|uniref:4Fe-4S binding protein n=1 Tax=Propionivibrio sp. TaxID=2212460 RepID=UPI002601DF44|nr:4Fe-4S binding protein [Propionivibrio sp.]
MKQSTIQRSRLFMQMGFFVLFTLTPVFDLLRYDLTEGHAYFLTHEWHVGIDDFIAGTVSPLTAAGNVLLYLFLPLLGVLALILGIAWKWGRLYCGWLCPHFSVVETINRLMLRATGKHSLWDKRETAPWEPDGRPSARDARYWLLVVPFAIGFAFAWALVFLTYLMPPFQVYGGLLNFSLSKYEVIFIGVVTSVLSAEFLFARHLFCRYACAIGIWQSIAWIGNKKAMVVGFDRERINDCANCVGGKTSACDAVCPMRLKPRNVKRWMFACTQCGQCLSACETANHNQPQGALLHWVSGEAARQNEAGFNATTLKRLRQLGATEDEDTNVR